MSVTVADTLALLRRAGSSSSGRRGRPEVTGELGGFRESQTLLRPVRRLDAHTSTRHVEYRQPNLQLPGIGIALYAG
jgi:hypothetical protein